MTHATDPSTADRHDETMTNLHTQETTTANLEAEHERAKRERDQWKISPLDAPVEYRESRRFCAGSGWSAGADLDADAARAAEAAFYDAGALGPRRRPTLGGTDDHRRYLAHVIASDPSAKMAAPPDYRASSPPKFQAICCGCGGVAFPELDKRVYPKLRPLAKLTALGPTSTSAAVSTAQQLLRDSLDERLRVALSQGDEELELLPDELLGARALEVFDEALDGRRADLTAVAESSASAVRNTLRYPIVERELDGRRYRAVELQSSFHTAWGQATDRDDYNKEDWKRAQRNREGERHTLKEWPVIVAAAEGERKPWEASEALVALSFAIALLLTACGSGAIGGDEASDEPLVTTPDEVILGAELGAGLADFVRAAVSRDVRLTYHTEAEAEKAEQAFREAGLTPGRDRDMVFMPVRKFDRFMLSRSGQ